MEQVDHLVLAAVRVVRRLAHLSSLVCLEFIGQEEQEQGGGRGQGLRGGEAPDFVFAEDQTGLHHHAIRIDPTQLAALEEPVAVHATVARHRAQFALVMAGLAIDPAGLIHPAYHARQIPTQPVDKPIGVYIADQFLVVTALAVDVCTLQSLWPG